MAMQLPVFSMETKKGFYSAYQYTIHIPCVDNTLPIVSGIDTAAECEAYFRHIV